MSIAEIPSHPPTDRRWKQRIAQSKGTEMQLVLHDHSNGLYVPDDGQPSLKVADVPFHDYTKLTIDNRTSPVLAVAHIDTAADGRNNFQTGLFAAAQGREETAARPVIVLQASRTGSVGDSATAAENIVWLSMKSRDAYTKVSVWLPEFMKLDFETAKKLVEIANSGDRVRASAHENDYAHLLDIILPGRIENRLAFRLLCEAYKFKNIDRKSDYGGLEIHAPEGIGQWLDPFGKKNGADSAATAKAIDEVSSLIGSGTIRDAAKAVLNAVNGTGGKLDDAINDFLEKVAKPIS